MGEYQHYLLSDSPGKLTASPSIKGDRSRIEADRMRVNDNFTETSDCLCSLAFLECASVTVNYSSTLSCPSRSVFSLVLRWLHILLCIVVLI